MLIYLFQKCNKNWGSAASFQRYGVWKSSGAHDSAWSPGFLGSNIKDKSTEAIYPNNMLYK